MFSTRAGSNTTMAVYFTRYKRISQHKLVIPLELEAVVTLSTSKKVLDIWILITWVVPECSQTYAHNLGKELQ